MKKRNNSFNGKKGISSKILSEKLSKATMENARAKSKKILDKKPSIKDSFKSGKCEVSDMKDLVVGFTAFEQILKHGLDIMESKMLITENDVSKTKMNLVNFKNTMDVFFRRIQRGLRDEDALRSDLKFLKDNYRIMQAARDGIILKQEKRIEKDKYGIEREITYDISMSPREVFELKCKYQRMYEEIKFNKINNYIALGMSFIGVLGMFAQEKNETKKEGSSSFSILSLGSLAVAGVNIAQRYIPRKDMDESRALDRKARQMGNELLDNEQISYMAEQKSLEEIEEYMRKGKKLKNKVDNQDLAMDATLNIVISLLTGMYLKNKITIKENGKIDAKSLADAMISLGKTRGYLGSSIDIIYKILGERDTEIEFLEFSKVIGEIEKQMEEKVYPLEGAKKAFNSVEIKNFDGKFYPTTDYETGEVKYNMKISVPGFSMKRGDVVLLSGESGAGKSTFLRFLKRGDINNRNQIKLDDNEIVDNLGNEYISFRPSTNLGDESSILNQITGKNSISTLTKEEKNRLIKIMKDLKLYKENYFEDMANRKFMQFSTGQQRRLALAKVLFRINDATSVIIVDEPVGNVEESLIKEQFKILTQYAKENNLMMILVTHNNKLAEEFVTKRYHISKEGRMEEVPIKEQFHDEIE